MSPPEPSFCEACAGITPKALNQPDGYSHLQNALDLLSSAKTCSMCALIRKAMEQDIKATRTDEMVRNNMGAEPIILYGIGDGLNVDDKDSSCAQKNDSPQLFGVQVHIPDREFGFDLVTLSLFTDAESTARANGDVIGRRLFEDPGSPEAMDLVRQWYDGCISDHLGCNGSYSGPGGSTETTPVPELPTRILDLGPRDHHTEPRLFVSNGARARYAALSHCWGKHRFLTTTTHNLAQHCQSIKLADLPKTFRDAIVIARSLDLRYLWIDSLCIVQDDPDDWRRESVRMGRVYKDAAITIAATGAHNGTEGCFVPRPTPQPVVRLPLPRDAGESNAIYATLFPDQEDSSLTEAALGGRAWITQEWMLSPRTIHYTKARMTWACRTTLKSEDGYQEVAMDEQRLFDSAREYRESKNRGEDNSESMLGFLGDWCDLVSTYTSRRLTYETDKPIAILGLATEIGSGVGERYTAGIFPGCSAVGSLPNESATNAIIIQLLWFAKHTLTRPPSLQNQPSWSWTSTIGGISFFSLAQTARPVLTNLQVCEVQSPAPGQPQVILRLTTLVKRWEKTNSWPMGDPGPGRIGYFNTTEFYSRTSGSMGGVPSQRPFYFLGPDSKPAGWAAFDLGDWPAQDSELFVSPFSAHVKDGQTDGFNVLFLGEVESVNKQDKERRFKRLGFGEIIDRAWFDDCNSEAIMLQ